jgi:hypothetical protein
VYGLSGGAWGIAAYHHVQGDFAAFDRYILQTLQDKQEWGKQPLMSALALCTNAGDSEHPSCHQLWRQSIQENVFPQPERMPALSSPKREVNIVMSMCRQVTGWSLSSALGEMEDYGICTLHNNERIRCSEFKDVSYEYSRLPQVFDPRNTVMPVGLGRTGDNRMNSWDYLTSSSFAYSGLLKTALARVGWRLRASVSKLIRVHAGEE